MSIGSTNISTTVRGSVLAFPGTKVHIWDSTALLPDCPIFDR